MTNFKEMLKNAAAMPLKYTKAYVGAAVLTGAALLPGESKADGWREFGRALEHVVVHAVSAPRPVVVAPAPVVVAQPAPVVQPVAVVQPAVVAQPTTVVAQPAVMTPAGAYYPQGGDALDREDAVIYARERARVATPVVHTGDALDREDAVIYARERARVATPVVRGGDALDREDAMIRAREMGGRRNGR